MIRLDQAHKNVKNIVSIVKGVFHDYVYKPPHVSLEVWKEKEFHPPTHSYHHRSGNAHSFRSEFQRRYYDPSVVNTVEETPLSQHTPTAFMKRVLRHCYEDDDEKCENRDFALSKPNRMRRPIPVLKQVPMLLPIYVEAVVQDDSEEELIDSLPRPLNRNQAVRTEANWVKTWDKKTGLPEVLSPQNVFLTAKNSQHSLVRRRNHVWQSL